MGEAGGTEQLPWRHPKARFLGAPPRFFAQGQRNGVERAVGGRDFYPRKRRTRTSPLPQVGRGTYSPPTCSAHANGGATEVKKALFFGGSTPFLWASTKEMGSNRRTGHRPPPNVSAHTYKPKEKKGEPPARVPPWTPPPLKRWTKLSNAREARSEVRRSGSGPGGRRPGRGWRWRRGSRRRSRRPR